MTEPYVCFFCSNLVAIRIRFNRSLVVCMNEKCLNAAFCIILHQMKASSAKVIVLRRLESLGILSGDAYQDVVSLCTT